LVKMGSATEVPKMGEGWGKRRWKVEESNTAKNRRRCPAKIVTSKGGGDGARA